jgi:hypothetical protein
MRFALLSGSIPRAAGLKRIEAATGAVTLIQRFGSAANLNIHLHCLVLDGVYRTTEGVPVFHAVRAPTAEQLQALLTRIVERLMRNDRVFGGAGSDRLNGFLGSDFCNGGSAQDFGASCEIEIQIP